MSAKIKYTDEPLGEIRVVPDFLPSPSELAFREEGVKVTLALSVGWNERRRTAMRKKLFRPILLCEILREEFMKPLGLSANRSASVSTYW